MPAGYAAQTRRPHGTPNDGGAHRTAATGAEREDRQVRVLKGRYTAHQPSTARDEAEHVARDKGIRSSRAPCEQGANKTPIHFGAPPTNNSVGGALTTLDQKSAEWEFAAPAGTRTEPITKEAPLVLGTPRRHPMAPLAYKRIVVAYIVLATTV